MNAFKELCIKLRKQDYTLPEIVRITGRPKTSVYAHIKSIRLSPRKLRQISKSSGQRVAKLSFSRKGTSTRKFNSFNRWDVNTVSLVSHFIFDGSIIRQSCIYNNRSASLLKHMEKSMQHIYSFPPKLYTNPVTGVSRISYHNVALASYLKERSAELLNDVPRMSLDLKREFIKSFFDDEGCIDYRPKRNLRRIRGYQKDTTILTLIQCLLSDFNINSTVILPNEVVITGKNDLQKFQKEIGFSKGVFINGNRTNSIWKKSLEKRAILKAAIESYRK